MAETHQEPAPKKDGAGLRLRIILTFLLAGAILAALLSFAVYRILESSLAGRMAEVEARLVLSSTVRILIIVDVLILALTLAVSLALGSVVIRWFATSVTVRQYRERSEALLTAYGRFVPHEFLRLLGKASILDVKLGDQTEKTMSILFSDIVSFTSLSETMTPFQNFNFLNSYLKRTGPQIRSRGGFIDKYIGDGIMALFPRSPDDALSAAVGMQTMLEEYNVHRNNSGYRPIAIGVGVHTGTLMLGTVGEDQRMDGSVISDAVNLCSRLQGLTRVYGSAVITTGQTLKMLENPAQFHCRFIDRVRVRGKKETVLLFEVLDGEPEAQRDLKLGYRADLAEALRKYFAQDFAGARDIVARLGERNPADEVLRIYRGRCDRLVENGVPAAWEGIEEFDAR